LEMFDSSVACLFTGRQKTKRRQVALKTIRKRTVDPVTFVCARRGAIAHPKARVACS